MLSKKMFECIDEVCKIKNESVAFGGLQIILTGDFTQLPPVPNPMYQEEGDFCFESQLFKIIPHMVMLKEPIRQSEPQLIAAIQECALGTITLHTEEFIKSLNRPLPDNVDSVKLFSRNDQVDEYNRHQILAFKGKLFVFQAEDEGDNEHLRKVLAPKTLWLKEGAPVILLQNLSSKLVNGLRGLVHHVSEDCVIIDIPSINMKVPLEKKKFTVFSPCRNVDVACRTQYPIKLCFSMTIHKSQGLTLESVEIDCRQIFKPGQLGVALGRTTTTSGLRVINFNPKGLIPQPDKVLNFINSTWTEPRDDKKCCRFNAQSSKDVCEETSGFVSVADLIMMDEAAELFEQQADSDEEFDSEFNEAIYSMEEQSVSMDLPEDLEIDAILDSIHCKIVKTPMQYKTNMILKEIDRAIYVQFCKTQYLKMRGFVEEMNIDPSKPVPSKHQTDFYRKVHAYQTGTEYRMTCFNLFPNVQFTDVHMHICFNILSKIRIYILQKKAQLFPVGRRKISERTATNASEARVRYVGGYCVAKVKYKYMQQKKHYMYKVDKSSQAQYEDTIQAVSILDSMKVDEYSIKATTANPDSLLDVTRRQRLHSSLTHIPDDVFSFFMKLTEICLNLLIDENMNKYGCNLFSEIQSKIHESSELYDCFAGIVRRSMSEQEEFEDVHCRDGIENIVPIIYRKITKQYLMVMTNQFRKDILESFCVEKKMAHRKQVQVRKRKQTQKTTVEQSTPGSIQEYCTPSTSKRSLEEEPSCSFAKANKSSVAEFSICGPVDTAADEDDEPCKGCHLTSKQTPAQKMWICCDDCQGWFHRKCAGLQQHHRWRKYQQRNVKFLCQQCEKM